MSFDLFNKEHETLEQGMELARQAARVDASLAQQVKGLSDAYGKLLNTTKKSAAPTPLQPTKVDMAALTRRIFREHGVTAESMNVPLRLVVVNKNEAGPRRPLPPMEKNCFCTPCWRIW